MKRNFRTGLLITLSILLLMPCLSLARTKLQGYAEKGGVALTISGGIGSVPQTVKATYPGATVTIYNTGTLVAATCYADAAGTPKANPFTADSTGYWYAYVESGRYDVRFSGTGITSPFTYSDIIADDSGIDYVINSQSFGTTGDGVADDTAEIQATFTYANTIASAFAYDIKPRVVIPAGNYVITSQITVSSSVDVDATGAVFLVNANVTPFYFYSAPEVVALSANYTVGSTTLAVNTMTAALTDGQAFKIVSDAVDPGNRDSGSSTSQWRVGEWAYATGGNTTSITLKNPLRFSRGINPVSGAGDEAMVDAYTTAYNARVLVLTGVTMSWTGGTITYESGHGATPWTARAMQVIGYTDPRIKNLTINKGYGPGIQLAGCVRPVVESSRFENLENDTAQGQYGYGVADGSFMTIMRDSSCSNVRHCYTSSAATATAGSVSYPTLLSVGRIVGARVLNNIGYANGAVAVFDTHHESEDALFEGNIVYNSDTFAYTFRGRNIHSRNDSAINCKSGIQMYTEYQSGDPDDDLYVAGKPYGVTTGIIENFTAEVEEFPVKVIQARNVKVIGGRWRSTNHIMIRNDGSYVEMDGNIDFATTTYDGAYTITEYTGKGVFDLDQPINAALSSSADWTDKIVVNRGADIKINTEAATDGALNHLGIVVLDDATCYFENRGRISATLSTAFDVIMYGTAANITSDPDSIFRWSITGAADNTATEGLTGSNFRAFGEDGTFINGYSVINVKDAPYSAKGDGTTDDTAAIQAAIDAAESLTSTFLIDTGITVLFPPGRYLVTALTLQKNNVALVGEGTGAVLYSTTAGAHTLLTIGHTDFSAQVYHNTIRNLTFYAANAIADRTDTVAIAAYDTIQADIENCKFNNWAISIDGYRFNTSSIHNVKFMQWQRTAASKATAAISLRGKSTTGQTSGGNHIYDFEILGSAATANSVYTNGFLITSVDGLYVDNGHLYKYDYGVHFAPTGTTNTDNNIEGVKFSNVYFDEPTTHNVYFSGATAAPGGLGGTVGGNYQNVVFDTCYFRGGAVFAAGAAYADYLINIGIDSVTSSVFGFQFYNCEYYQWGVNAVLVTGTADSDVDIQHTVFDGGFAYSGQRDGAQTSSFITAELEDITIRNIHAGADSNNATYWGSITLPNATGSASLGPNNLKNATFTNHDPWNVTAATGSTYNIAETYIPDSYRITDSVIDVRMFGATGDGTTDDYASIQAAIDYLEVAGGGKLFLPTGTYQLSATLTVESAGIEIEGTGEATTILRATHSSGAVIRVQEGYSKLRNFQVTSSAARLAGAAGSNYGIYYEPTSGASDRCWHDTIEHVYVQSQPNHGFVFIAGVYGLSLKNVRSYNNIGHGMIFDNGTLTSRTNKAGPGLFTISDSELSFNDGNGLVIGGSNGEGSNYAIRAIIDNCDISRNAEAAGTRKSVSQVYVFGSQIVFRASVFNSLNIAGDTAASSGITLYGRDIRLENNRWIEVSPYAVEIYNNSDLPTTGITVHDVYIVNSVGADCDPAVYIDSGLQSSAVIEVNAQRTNDFSALYTQDQSTIFRKTPRIVYKADDQVVNNSETSVVVTGLSVPVINKQVYHFRAFIIYTGNTAADIKFGFVVPASSELTWCTPTGIAVATDDSVARIDAIVAGSTYQNFGADANKRVLELVGTLKTTGTAGTLNLAYAQASAHASDTTVYSESSLIVW